MFIMSPSSREINGPRPAPLKIHKDSHLIHKQSSSSSSSSSTTTTTTTTTSSSSTQRHQPVIIYTHSPKIIHTQARDFMALVQKLTGLSRSTDGKDDSAAAANNPPPPPSNIPRKDADTVHAATDDSSSSSENCSIAGDVVHHVSCCSLPSATAMSPLSFDLPPPPNPFLSEIPLFTPNSSEFFCSSRSFYRYPESAAFPPSIPNMGGSISPSIMEAMKAFPEY